MPGKSVSAFSIDPKQLASAFLFENLSEILTKVYLREGFSFHDLDLDTLTAVTLTVSKAISGWGTVPIGGIIPFHPNIASPALSVPDNFAPCNGATISDSESPLNGLTLPNLNGSAYGSSGRGRYLRGGSTSGLLNPSTYKVPGGTDNVYGGSGGYYGAWVYTFYGLDGDASGSIDRIFWLPSRAMLNVV